MFESTYGAYEDEVRGLRVAITGGTSGLGLALVRELRARGAHIAFVARRREDLERVMLQEVGAHGIVGNVAKKEDIHPMALQIVGLLGGLDVLINNASDLGPAPLELLRVDLERNLHGYRTHEFGDSVFVERAQRPMFTEAAV